MTYSECEGSDLGMESSVNTKSGLVTVPQDGFYEITFTGALKTYDAKRIWVTIMKKSKDGKGNINIL